MPSFLLIISFLLHIILLIAVYYLFQQIQSLKQDHTKELTDLFETYLQDIKNENHRLEAEISSHTPRNEANENPIVSDFPNKEEITNITEKNEPIIKISNIDDVFETSLEARILQLYHEGMAVEDIAKRLNCGKTEAELVINLYKKGNHKA